MLHFKLECGLHDATLAIERNFEDKPQDYKERLLWAVLHKYQGYNLPQEIENSKDFKTIADYVLPHSAFNSGKQKLKEKHGQGESHDGFIDAIGNLSPHLAEYASKLREQEARYLESVKEIDSPDKVSADSIATLREIINRKKRLLAEPEKVEEEARSSEIENLQGTRKHLEDDRDRQMEDYKTRLRRVLPDDLKKDSVGEEISNYLTNENKILGALQRILYEGKKAVEEEEGVYRYLTEVRDKRADNAGTIGEQAKYHEISLVEAYDRLKKAHQQQDKAVRSIKDLYLYRQQAIEELKKLDPSLEEGDPRKETIANLWQEHQQSKALFDPHLAELTHLEIEEPETDEEDVTDSVLDKLYKRKIRSSFHKLNSRLFGDNLPEIVSAAEKSGKALEPFGEIMGEVMYPDLRENKDELLRVEDLINKKTEEEEEERKRKFNQEDTPLKFLDARIKELKGGYAKEQEAYGNAEDHLAGLIKNRIASREKESLDIQASIDKQLDYLKNKFNEHYDHLSHPTAVMEARRLGGKDYAVQLEKIKERQKRQSGEQFVKASQPWLHQMTKDAHDRSRENQADEIALVDLKLNNLNAKNKRFANYTNQYNDLIGRRDLEKNRINKLKANMFLSNDIAQLQRAKQEEQAALQAVMTEKEGEARANKIKTLQQTISGIDQTLSGKMSLLKEQEEAIFSQNAIGQRYIANHAAAMGRHNTHDRDTAIMQGVAAIGSQLPGVYNR